MSGMQARFRYCVLYSVAELQDPTLFSALQGLKGRKPSLRITENAYGRGRINGLLTHKTT